MNVLIIGGNRFFGQRLTRQLVESRCGVTLLNRGNHDDGFGEKVSRLICNRESIDQLNAAIEDRSWDIVFDQACFNQKHAAEACRVFAGRTQRYVYISSQSVYSYGKGLKEADFSALQYESKSMGNVGEDFSEYVEGKRNAELEFARSAPFSYLAVRLPIILGEDDWTERLLFHVRRIQNGDEIYFPNLASELSFIHAEDAASALIQLAQRKFVGPINCAAPDQIAIETLVNYIESATEKNLKRALFPRPEVNSPFGLKESWTMDVSLMATAGIRTRSIDEWLPKLIGELVTNL